jgi:hypothetical protein
VAWWIPALIGAAVGTVLAVIWLAALRKLLERQQSMAEPEASDMHSVPSSAALQPIASFLDPDEDEPHTPLPSQSMAPLTFNRYIEVRGAIEGWTLAGMDVELELKEVFDLQRTKYDEAHTWWMSALEGADDRLRDVERRVEVFAERYGGTSG